MSWRGHAPYARYHLLLETPEPNLVRGMRRLNGMYTQAFNRRHRRVGHVLQGRYKSIVVDRRSYLLELCRYVVLNPVRADTVASVEDWRWSSYLSTVGKLPCPPWLAANRVLGLFGPGAVARKAYKRFVARGQKQPSPWQALKGQIYLGSEAFRARMQKRLSGNSAKGIPRAQLSPIRPERACGDRGRYRGPWDRAGRGAAAPGWGGVQGSGVSVAPAG